MNRGWIFQKPNLLSPNPDPALKGKDEIEVMYKLIVAALQTDSTRVMTYRMPGQALLQSMGVTLSAHNVSHYSQGERMDASEARDKIHGELLAGLIDNLKATKEADGTSLFDHVSRFRLKHQFHPLP